MFPSARPNLHEPPPASTVADRLKRARRRRFVGRAAELELFLGALAAPEPPFSVLWIHGPGGVGKTALLGALAEAAADAGVGAVQPRSARDRAFATGVHGRAGARASGCPARRRAEALGGREPVVLLLDTFEAAVGLEDWLREQFVPALPACALVVVAGRNGPGAAWRRDPGWGDLLRVVSLRNLGPDDARALPARRGCRGGAAGVDARALARPPARVVAAGGRALAAAGGGGRGAVGVGRGARRGGAAGGELPGRRAEPAPSAGARMRRPTRG